MNHLLNMLNSDDSRLREMARASYTQHLQRRKVPIAQDNDAPFLGFKVKSNGNLDITAASFGVRSDWLDLNDLCNCTGIHLRWARPEGAKAVLNNGIITDPLIYTCATGDVEPVPSSKYARVYFAHTGPVLNCKES